ncbi:MAG TPA: hypothetical protein VMD99_14440 [Terriglobales bacterium]|nr:hypothetical protein [Terriglobales bacterium]
MRTEANVLSRHLATSEFSKLFTLKFAGAIFLPKACASAADLTFMVNPISSSHASQTSQESTPPPSKPQPQQKSTQPQDTVSLKSTGTANPDGNSA